MSIRKLLKRVAQGASVVIVFPGALLCAFGRFPLLYTLMAQSIALVPGVVGDLCRSAFYMLTLRECSIDTVIAFGTFFSKCDVYVGPNVSIGSFCVIGRARIGSRTQIASHVEIPSGRHQHNRDTSNRLANSVDGEVAIGSDCWIGASAIIMADVGSGTTIGAGSVVVKDVPSGVIAAGNPAMTIRQANLEKNSTEGEQGE